mmetsp:Transcript_61302/g.113820  ORF Transcript_61302/g.113820 Transcript_61302/m.113820 type:complete len:912 (-) Transcript_61302:191-2926(-)
MSRASLKMMFEPKSVAVIGASDKEGKVGNIVMRNMLQAGYSGAVLPITKTNKSVCGVLSYPEYTNLPCVPDLAVLCTPAPTILKIIKEIAAVGTRAAIILAAGLSAEQEKQVVQAAQEKKVRLLGPNCLGLMVPPLGINASFGHRPAKSGSIAFASQSGAMCTAVLDWARIRGIGFSHFISIGDCAETGFGDVLDYLADDPKCEAIIMYIESIKQPRMFISSARKAARKKTVLVIKSGRYAEGAAAAASHTGALAGSDEVFDAAIRRSGMLRVDDLDDMFPAVETLARGKPLLGEKLTIVTNGGGIGVLAVDALVGLGGKLATLSQETIDKLNEILPEHWSHGNPVDIIGDAPGRRYAGVMKILMQAPEVGSLLVMHAPTATTNSFEASQAVVEVVKSAEGDAKKINILTCWVGGEAVMPCRQVFHDAAVPTYNTPRQSVAAFMHMVKYKQSQDLLMETPAIRSDFQTPAYDAAMAVIKQALARGKGGSVTLTEIEAKEVLYAYGVPVIRGREAKTPEEAAKMAKEIGYPVVLKILSKDISHKSDVGGVALNLGNDEQVIEAAKKMLEQVSVMRPDAVLDGFNVQNMANKPRAHELIVGVTTDPIFGPVILFGQGGTAVEVVRDSAMALPPLNVPLARSLVNETRVAKLLQGYRDRPAADMDSIYKVLLDISQIVADIPEVSELDINPLFVDENGAVGVDGRIVVQPAGNFTEEFQKTDRLAIRPYPKMLEQEVTTKEGEKIFLRPIRPEDEHLHFDFINKITDEDWQQRFVKMDQVTRAAVTHEEMAKFTHIDYDREMAFMAVRPRPGGPQTLQDGTVLDVEELGVVRVVMDIDLEGCEYTILIRSDMKGHGLGHLLTDKIVSYCKARGVKTVNCSASSDNQAMLSLAQSLGFEVSEGKDNLVQMRMTLQ